MSDSDTSEASVIPYSPKKFGWESGQIHVSITNFAGHALLPLVYERAGDGMMLSVKGKNVGTVETLVFDRQTRILKDQAGRGGRVDDSDYVLYELHRLAETCKVRNNLELPALPADYEPQPVTRSYSKSSERERESLSPGRNTWEKLYNDGQVYRNKQEMRRRAWEQVNLNADEVIVGHQKRRVCLLIADDAHIVISEAGLSWNKSRSKRCSYGATEAVRSGIIAMDIVTGVEVADDNGNVLIDFDDGASEYWPSALFVKRTKPVNHSRCKYHAKAGCAKCAVRHEELPTVKQLLDELHGSNTNWRTQSSDPKSITKAHEIRVKNIQEAKEAKKQRDAPSPPMALKQGQSWMTRLKTKKKVPRPATSPDGGDSTRDASSTKESVGVVQLSRSEDDTVEMKLDETKEEMTREETVEFKLDDTTEMTREETTEIKLDDTREEMTREETVEIKLDDTKDGSESVMRDGSKDSALERSPSEISKKSSSTDTKSESR